MELIHRRIEIETADGSLSGDLTIPLYPRGLVIFAHGSGSGRKSPRNRAVARLLENAGLATLLVDLLTEAEETIDRRTREYRFDLELIARRLLEVTKHATNDRELSSLPIGYFGASTGSAAALIAAARASAVVHAVVSRGGRPDLADRFLPHVAAPTLLLVGEKDPQVLQLNKRALAALDCEKKLLIVRRAGHLFEEPGALELVSRHAAEWFAHHLSVSPAWEALP